MVWGLHKDTHVVLLWLRLVIFDQTLTIGKNENHWNAKHQRQPCCAFVQSFTQLHVTLGAFARLGKSYSLNQAWKLKAEFSKLLLIISTHPLWCCMFVSYNIASFFFSHNLWTAHYSNQDPLTGWFLAWRHNDVSDVFNYQEPVNGVSDRPCTFNASECSSSFREASENINGWNRKHWRLKLDAVDVADRTQRSCIWLEFRGGIILFFWKNYLSYGLWFWNESDCLNLKNTNSA